MMGPSVTRLDNLLHFGQLFKACGNNYFAQIAHILGNIVKLLKNFIFLVKLFWATFIDIWRFFCHTVRGVSLVNVDHDRAKLFSD